MITRSGDMDSRFAPSSRGSGAPPTLPRRRRSTRSRRTRVRLRARLRRRILSLVAVWVAVAAGLTALPGPGSFAVAVPAARATRVWIDSAAPTDAQRTIGNRADRSNTGHRSNTDHTVSVDVHTRPHDASASWTVPVGPAGGPPPVVHGFDPPDQPWLAGHRGVDLAASADASVHAAADGVVVHAGQVGGVGVVSISHGMVRSTYQPVDASVSAGARVGAGEGSGSLGS